MTWSESPGRERNPKISAATSIRRAAEYRRIAFVVRRLPADFLTFQFPLDLTSEIVVTLERIGRAVELWRFERTRRITDAAILGELIFRREGLGVDVEEL
jgi:hypothetical protein